MEQTVQQAQRMENAVGPYNPLSMMKLTIRMMMVLQSRSAQHLCSVFMMNMLMIFNNLVPQTILSWSLMMKNQVDPNIPPPSLSKRRKRQQSQRMNSSTFRPKYIKSWLQPLPKNRRALLFQQRSRLLNVLKG